MTVRGGMAGVVRVQERENCNSRHFSRFMKSCCPNPNDPSHSFVVPNRIVAKPRHSAGHKTSVSCLPDDILCEILSRLPYSSLSAVAAVCRHWSHLLDSPSFAFLRRRHGLLHPTLFAFSFTHATSFSTLRLLLDDSWSFSGNDAVSFPLLPDIHADVSHARLTAVGRKVFIIGRSSCLFFDPWTGLIKSRSGPLFPRKRFAVASVNGRIYVAGGSARSSALEEYDPDANEWRVVSDAPRRRYGCIGVSMEGVFYVIGGLKIGGASDTRAAIAGAEARVYASSMDLYDVAARGWLRSKAVPGGGCVVAACGANGHVYVLASHTVELSFWRFYAKRKGGGGVFGEWCRMRSPPLPAQVRLDGTVKFGCVGVEDKVVLIQVMGCIDDLLRRSGRNVRGYKGGLVLVFDCVTQEWSRGPDLPDLVLRAACVSVQC